MKAEYHIFGHAVRWQKKNHPNGECGGWFYVDNGEPHVSIEGTVAGTEALNPRKCPTCDKYPTDEGHDPCIANLPGVNYACCGHGVRPGYISFEDGRVIRGNFTELPKPENVT